MQEEIEELKTKRMTPPVLAVQNFEAPIIVGTDASAVTLWIALSQKNADGKLYPVQNASCTIKNEWKCNFTSKRTLAVMFMLKKFCVYLLSDITFVLFTDHKALQYAFPKKDIHAQLASRMGWMEQYDFEFIYRPSVADNAAE